MIQSITYEGKVWDIMVPRSAPTSLSPVWAVRYDREAQKMSRFLVCQVMNIGRFGWSVVVEGKHPPGVGVVEGFKHRWQAIRYAINVNPELNNREDLFR